MILKIGKLMGLRFTPEALSHIFEQYGGHPLLTRLACSLTAEFAKAGGKRLPLVITDCNLKQTQEQRNTELRFYCRHIVSELERYYPEEYRLLELLSTGEFLEFQQQARKNDRVAHLFKYGVISEPSTPYVTYDVLREFVAEENARKEGRDTPFRVVPELDRTSFLQVRIRAVIEDMRSLEKLIRQTSTTPKPLPSLFGPNSFPEADHLLAIKSPTDANGLAAALTPLYRSFVESIENYGQSLGKKNYFWGDIKQHFSYLHEALHRIRVYRHDGQHLKLVPNADAAFRRFLDEDLPGDLIHSEDRYWIVLQRCLDSIHRSLQREISNLRQ